jgi:hypothetical protein
MTDHIGLLIPAGIALITGGLSGILSSVSIVLIVPFIYTTL